MKTLPSDPDMADRVLIDIGREAFKHARELLRAARLILDAGIWSVAYANAALALEELGKATLCTSVLPLPDGQRQAEMDAFPDRFTSHEAKAFCAFLVLRMVEDHPRADWAQISKNAERDAKRTNKNKFRGLYVDYKNSGHLLKPTDITKAQASELIATAEKVLELAKDAEESLDNMEVNLPVLRQFRSLLEEHWASEESMLGLLSNILTFTGEDAPSQEQLRGTPLGAVLETMGLFKIEPRVAELEGEPQ
ncbi:AbiV family abortive infection protein [Streptomyces sp. NPDC013012]|uniref:AbiV family abortive infection protein n=1 Tax=Streptomyces sp. NPDC013012 TaxID=3364860 RepID=UPI0036A2F6CD